MTMEKISNVIIGDILPATAKNGRPYWKLETSVGRMSLFDAELARDLYAGLVCDVEVVRTDNFVNLKMAYPASNPSIKAEVAAPAPVGRPAYDNHGARVGMAVNNAVLLAVHGKLNMTEQDVDIMQPIARAAAAIIAMSKELERK